MAKKQVRNEALTELLYQALETELGGVEIYRNAVQCAQNPELLEEWEKYLSQTEEHVRILRAALEGMELDPDLDTPGRQIVRHLGKSLIKAIQLALGSLSPEDAQLVACECVVLGETKDHANWSLLRKLLQDSPAGAFGPLRGAVELVEPEEDEHLYHTQGWSRELWLEALGLQAQLPPPEEQDDVQSEEEAVKARMARA